MLQTQQPNMGVAIMPAAMQSSAVVVKLTVTVPQGINGGDLVRVAAPDGSYHSIMVPSGLASGQQLPVLASEQELPVLASEQE